MEKIDDRLVEAEKRITKLEDIQVQTSKTLRDIEKIAMNVQTLLTGGTEIDSIGIISVIRDGKKNSEDNSIRIINLEAKVSAILEEAKKYKWYIRGLILGLTLKILYETGFLTKILAVL